MFALKSVLNLFCWIAHQRFCSWTVDGELQHGPQITSSSFLYNILATVYICMFLSCLGFLRVLWFPPSDQKNVLVWMCVNGRLSVWLTGDQCRMNPHQMSAEISSSWMDEPSVHRVCSQPRLSNSNALYRRTSFPFASVRDAESLHVILRQSFSDNNHHIDTL